ncbi:MAG: saccharopine dehydrogenase NADP-binding domain-containing protein [Clostridiales Family XIII bacterium]|jgi:saccharopine dehydrogenase-like NADP-dependent oxidoreductase|nr:saccharopine dehydrogenase NADP-binding domain-containing protein [Clostridiales Family XIII bacterium]
MGKKVLVLGVGAQGSTVAQRLDEEPNVEEIICADYDPKAVNELVGILGKARGMSVDASDTGSIIEAANGVDLIVNALPLLFGKNALDAAVAVKANYQDFAAAEGMFTGTLDDDWVEGIKYMYREYGPKFREAGKLAVVGTGSAPGLICAATRVAVRELDSCDTILNIIYEGVESKRFQPFWWSPVTALSDMSEDAFAYIDGEIVRTPAFGLPVRRTYDYLDDEVKCVEHAHDEPVYMGLNAKEYFKGAKNIYFKYGGVGIRFAEPLYRAGLLSKKEETFNGQTIVPFDFVLNHVPPAPKFKDEIKAIIEEGLISDTGCMVVEAYGKKAGQDVKVETHVYAPGLEDSFARAGISSEMYITGQGGFLFTKMFVNDRYEQKGLITSDMLTYPEVDYYFEKAAELDITLETKLFEL